eukprot:8302767-Prorocentrum_lima.AAC.1
MTSSLVGSEMCIRDSLGPLRVNLHGSTGGRWHQERARERGFASVEIPVSYTHLTLPTICSV